MNAPLRQKLHILREHGEDAAHEEMRHILRVASALLQRLAHLREALGDVAGDAGGFLRRVEGMRLLPDALQMRADVVLAQIVHVDPKPVAVGEMAIGAPGSGEVGVKLQAVADVADNDEGRRRMIRIEQEDVRLRLLARILHQHVPALRDAALAEIGGLVSERCEFASLNLSSVRQARLLGLENEGIFLVEIDEF